MLGASAHTDRLLLGFGRSESTTTSNAQQDLYRRQEATSGNRDMYQEVDLIDIALGSARKQCDDAKERANRLSVTVDRLRDALSRFMSKVGRRRRSAGPAGAGRGAKWDDEKEQSVLSLLVFRAGWLNHRKLLTLRQSRSAEHYFTLLPSRSANLLAQRPSCEKHRTRCVQALC